MKKSFFAPLLLLPILASCSPKGGENSEQSNNENFKTVSLSQIMQESSLGEELPSRIWYYQFGFATNTIFNLDSENYSEVLKKFSDLEMEEKDSIQNNTTKDFYLSLFYDDESVDDKYILGMNESVAYVAFQSDEGVKYYAAEISEETYQNTKNYLNTLKKSAEI